MKLITLLKACAIQKKLSNLTVKLIFDFKQFIFGINIRKCKSHETSITDIICFHKILRKNNLLIINSYSYY